MKRSQVLLVILVLCLSIILGGCIEDDGKLHGSTQDDTKSDKPQHTNYLSYVMDKEYPLGQDVEIELSIGTRVTKYQIDNYPTEGVQAPYKLTISAISVEGEYDNQKMSEAFQKITSINPDASNAILIVDNFYMENYPFPDKKVEAITKSAILPQSLFTGDKGSIMIAYHLYVNAGVEIYYTIEDNTIFICNNETNQPGKTNGCC